jgi:hypothetical protein
MICTCGGFQFSISISEQAWFKFCQTNGQLGLSGKVSVHKDREKRPETSPKEQRKTGEQQPRPVLLDLLEQVGKERRRSRMSLCPPPVDQAFPASLSREETILSR